MNYFLSLLIVCLQCVTGAFLWNLVRRGKSNLIELAGVGLALGTAASALSGILLWQWLPVWGWLAPTALSLCVLPIIRMRTGTYFGHVSSERAGLRWIRCDRPSLIALLISLVLGFTALAVNMRAYPLHWSGIQDSYHPDMLFFEGISTSLAHYGPNDSIFMVGSDIRYHWLSYAWSGQLSQTIGAQPFVVLTRILPITALIATVLISIAWTRHLSTYRWAPTIAAVLVVSGGYVGATYGTILNFDSPSQQMATVWLLGLSLAFWQLVSSKSSRLLPMLAIIFVLSSASTLGKVSTGIVAIASWGFVTVVALLRHEIWARRALAALVASGLGAMWVYFDFINGSAEGGGLGIGSLLNKASSVQGLNPTNYWWGILLGTLLLLLAMSARWIGLIWLVNSPTSRWSPISTYGIGLVLVSSITVIFISGGLNDTWFALAASAPLSVISAVGVGRGLQNIDPQRLWLPSWPILAAAFCGIVLSGLVAAVWTQGPGHLLPVRWTAPVIGVAGAIVIAVVLVVLSRHGLHGSLRAQLLVLACVLLTVVAADSRVLGVVSPSFGVQPAAGIQLTEFKPIVAFLNSYDHTQVSSWTESEQSAGVWLQEHSSHSDLIATNVTFSPLVPALAARQTLISGLQYQAPYGRKKLLSEILDRESASIGFIKSPTKYNFGQLCSYGVSWVWVDRTRIGDVDWSDYAEIAFLNPRVAILRLNRSVC